LNLDLEAAILIEIPPIKVFSEWNIRLWYSASYNIKHWLSHTVHTNYIVQFKSTLFVVRWWSLEKAWRTTQKNIFFILTTVTPQIHHMVQFSSKVCCSTSRHIWIIDMCENSKSNYKEIETSCMYNNWLWWNYVYRLIDLFWESGWKL
jgi:hypothetical protein